MAHTAASSGLSSLQALGPLSLRLDAAGPPPTAAAADALAPRPGPTMSALQPGQMCLQKPGAAAPVAPLSDPQVPCVPAAEPPEQAWWRQLEPPAFEGLGQARADSLMQTLLQQGRHDLRFDLDDWPCLSQHMAGCRQVGQLRNLLEGCFPAERDQILALTVPGAATAADADFLALLAGLWDTGQAAAGCAIRCPNLFWLRLEARPMSPAALAALGALLRAQPRLVRLDLQALRLAPDQIWALWAQLPAAAEVVLDVDGLDAEARARLHLHRARVAVARQEPRWQMVQLQLEARQLEGSQHFAELYAARCRATRAHLATLPADAPQARRLSQALQRPGGPVPMRAEMVHYREHMQRRLQRRGQHAVAYHLFEREPLHSQIASCASVDALVSIFAGLSASVRDVMESVYIPNLPDSVAQLDRILCSLGRAPPKLTVLDLDPLPLGPDQVDVLLARLVNWPSLTILSLSAEKLGAGDLARLEAGLPQLGDLRTGSPAGPVTKVHREAAGRLVAMRAVERQAAGWQADLRAFLQGVQATYALRGDAQAYAELADLRGDAAALLGPGADGQHLMAELDAWAAKAAVYGERGPSGPTPNATAPDIALPA